MATNLKRRSFVSTLELEEVLKQLKREKYFDCSYSEMIRDLVLAGCKYKREEDKNGVTKNA